ncbi:MAG: glycoside hydrolase family 2 protein [Oscillospiraceae bacterium]|nr:glycoside hydrolase family 2 protein [Oscillospiraceae bacterium]
MRKVLNYNSKWAFSKETKEPPQSLPANWVWVNLPHSWNAIDGIDGDNDYYRGTCLYAKTVDKAEFLPVADRYFLEFQGANSSADLYVNGKHLAHHDGGYSTWRVDVTEEFKAVTTPLVVVAVDNAPNDSVYPQMADFTFYGGLYRDVNIICTNESHFDLEFFGGPGIKVTPKIEDKDADVEIEVFVKNPLENQKLVYTVKKACGCVVETKELPVTDTKVNIKIENVHLWHGVKDPYLYTAEVKLVNGDETVDEVSAKFGCRTFRIDPEEGFFLNGVSYPLHGVSRHQDRIGKGNALAKEDHIEDMELICEMGANTIRLAHYQHDQFFYDLCDEKGMVVWAEIPYISKHMPTGRENTISQMKELIAQNYNHPSIVVWGLSNEISMQGSDADLVENHVILNDLCHEWDPTRLTTIACVSMTPIDDPYIKVPDVISYNHYFGWYGGDTSMNGPWFDNFHKVNPTIPVGVSEYGCEALNWHTSDPKQGDYTEEYQAYYHEELIKQLFTRKYIWSTHVWNMFDFGADGRNEGGENGQNHKGLVTIDRKYKKDSFYAYKAWLSDDPFVHIAGKRYVDRVEDVTKVTVYSNQPEVELFANGVSLGKQTSDVHFFYFDVPNKGITKLKAVAGNCVDYSEIHKVEEFNQDYLLKEKGAILNWFDVTEVEGHFSINDKLSDIGKNPEAYEVFIDMMKQAMAGKDEESEKGVMNMMQGPMAEMMGGFTVLRMSGMMGTMGAVFTKEILLSANEKLNKIEK